jgi:hypothetical protein
MQISPKKPIIKERMGTWKAKGKPSKKAKQKKATTGFLGTVTRGAGIIGSKIASGLKNVTTVENTQKLGDWGRSTGEFMQSKSFGYSGTAPKKKKRKRK